MYFDNEKGLIKNTTKEQRQHMVDGAIAIGSTGGQLPTKSAMVLFQKYIDGEMEIDEVQNEVINNSDNYLE